MNAGRRPVYRRRPSASAPVTDTFQAAAASPSRGRAGGTNSRPITIIGELDIATTPAVPGGARRARAGLRDGSSIDLSRCTLLRVESASRSCSRSAHRAARPTGFELDRSSRRRRTSSGCSTSPACRTSSRSGLRRNSAVDGRVDRQRAARARHRHPVVAVAHARSRRRPRPRRSAAAPRRAARPATPAASGGGRSRRGGRRSRTAPRGPGSSVLLDGVQRDLADPPRRGCANPLRSRPPVGEETESRPSSAGSRRSQRASAARRRERDIRVNARSASTSPDPVISIARHLQESSDSATSMLDCDARSHIGRMERPAQRYPLGAVLRRLSPRNHLIRVMRGARR